MEPENVHIGATVRVRERHRIAERLGMVGRIIDRYGGDGYVAVDVRFSGGQLRLFRPEDLEEISPPTLVAFCARQAQRSVSSWSELQGVNPLQFAVTGVVCPG
jgi:hypothetical protein